MRLLLLFGLICGAMASGCSSDSGSNNANNIVINNSNNSNNVNNTNNSNNVNNSNNTTNTNNNTRPDTSPYYELDRVLMVDVEIDEADWDLLRNETRTFADILAGDCLSGRDQVFNYYSANVTVDGERVENVGIRKKGFLGSLSTSKPSLKIKFDKYVDNQLLEGALKRMTLNNSRQDPSKLNTCMSYHVFRQAGLIAPRCNFAKVSVNGEDFGVYIHVESIKKPMLRNHFADEDGNLYEGTLSDFRDVWNGSFEKKTNEIENDFSDIQQVTDAMATPGAGYLAALQEIVDTDQFLSFWATEVLVGHWDGYTGDRNNFYIYREPLGRFQFIPWGPDSAFRTINNPFNNFDDPQSVMAAGIIANRMYDDPATRAQYQERLTQLLDSAWDEAELNALVDQMALIVQTHALASVKAQAANDTDRIRNYIDGRRSIITNEIAASPDWPVPLDPPDLCWAEIGEVDIAFTATWGSRGSADPLNEGDAAVTTFDLLGVPQNFVDVGVTVGLDNQQDGAEIAFAGESMGDPTAQIVVVNIPLNLFTANTSVEINLTESTATTLTAQLPGFTMIRVAGHLPLAVIEIETVDMSPGGTVTGRIRGTIHNFGGPP